MASRGLIFSPGLTGSFHSHWQGTVTTVRDVGVKKKEKKKRFSETENFQGCPKRKKWKNIKWGFGTTNRDSQHIKRDLAENVLKEHIGQALCT